MLGSNQAKVNFEANFAEGIFGNDKVIEKYSKYLFKFANVNSCHASYLRV